MSTGTLLRQRGGSSLPFTSTLFAPDVPQSAALPYRIDIDSPPYNALDILVELRALDVEQASGKLSAILPDVVTHDEVASALGVPHINVSDAVGRDNGSVWLLNPQAIHIGGLLITSPDVPPTPKVLRLVDSSAFGTGYHPTTALSIEALAEILSTEHVESMLDVGTGSGILALTALMMGVPRAVGLDIDAAAVKIAGENARLNDLAERLQLVLGGPGAVDGTWPLVVANVLAAPLIEMAPVLVRRLGGRAQLVLSGIQQSLQSEVRKGYEHLGMRHIGSNTRAGWTVAIFRASW